MREIKFRAWDKCHKTMGYNIEGIESLLGSIELSGCMQDYDCFGQYLSHPEKFEIMQFTGLKDKSGKDIYEGDIVKHPYVFGKGKANVVYVGHGFTLESPSGNSICDEIYLDDCEVIGNIYEHPHLMKTE